MMMQAYKNIVCTALCYCLLSVVFINLCRAQGAQAVAGPKGVWVICGDLLPRDFTYKVLRKGPKTDWISVADVKLPVSKEEVKARMITTQRLAGIRTAQMPDERLQRLWERVAPVLLKESPFEIKEDYVLRSAVGTAWYDATADSATQYQYKIQLIANNKVLGEQLTQFVVYPGKRFVTQMRGDKIAADKGGIGGDFEVLNKGPMTHCKIYRSYYLRTGYQEIEADPVFITRKGKLYISFIDNTVVPKVPYTYVVVPFDAAGNAGAQSPELKLFDVPDNTILPSVTDLKTTSVEAKKAIKISWRLPKTQRITSIEVYRGDTLKGNFKKIGSVGPLDTVFMDENVLPITTYYYSLRLNGAYQSSPMSARAPGILRAVNKNLFPPKNLQVHLDSERVILTFQKNEPDTHAYYIYRATGRNGKLQQIGKPVITDKPFIAFADTLPPVAQPTVFMYAVADENTSYAISPKTNAMYVYYGGMISLPIPHDVSVHKNNDGKLQVIWPDMRKESKTIAGYMVYRRSRGYDGKSTLATPVSKTLIPATVNHYTDSLITDGTAYHYSVRTVGAGGKMSSPSSESGYTIQPDIPNSVANIKIFVQDGAVNLSWINPMGQDTKVIKIYRALQGKNPEEIASLAANAEAYADKNVAAGSIYYYTFIVQNYKGHSSILTTPVGVHMK